MHPYDFLAQRQSTPSRLLGEPGPDASQIAQLLALAVRVPDHGKLTPWRFVRIAGDTRIELGKRLAALALARDPRAEPAAIEKDRQRFSSAPLVLAVIARITPGHKIPEQEQLLSAGLSAYNLLLGARAMGFGAQWLTGWAAYDVEVGSWFGLASNERIISFVHIGTTKEAVPDRPRPEPMSLLTDLAF
jgi:nitroreductase